MFLELKASEAFSSGLGSWTQSFWVLFWNVYLFQESESDDVEIEICLTNIDDIFENESDNAECQETQSVFETDNEDINTQSVRFLISKN